MTIIPRALAAAVALACAAPAFAGDRPVATLDPSSARYESAESAAIVALSMAAPLSAESEYGGAILKCGEGFFFTAAVTSNDPRHIDYVLRMPAGCTVAAIYHTHPGSGRAAAQFSPDDVEQAQALGVPTYIHVADDGTVRVYDPRSMKLRRDKGRLSAAVKTSGRILVRAE